MAESEPNITLIFSGGVALGAYQAGGYAALHDHHLRPRWIAGSSTGAVNAAVIAGNRIDERIEKLRVLWQPDCGPGDRIRSPASERWRHLENWGSALRTRLVGRSGHFRPRPQLPWGPFVSLYDLSPLRERMTELIDFDRLNSGEIRMTVATVDIASGELVLFDTASGDRITRDHLLASCGYLPEFAPVTMDGRLLGDGGLAANAPIETMYLDPPERDLAVFVFDAFARDGAWPTDLETAVARKSDLMFANQTWLRLEAFCRERKLQRKLAGANGPSTALYYLSYRPDPSEAGSERAFDYAARSIALRWEAGAADVLEALRQHAMRHAGGVELIAIRRGEPRHAPRPDQTHRTHLPASQDS